MCGIAGIFTYHSAAPSVDRQELLRMREHMRARGPDGAGDWYSDDNRVGLAHRRLAIIDLTERGSQPMARSDSTAVITFNGEIYNYRELRKSLEVKGYRFNTDSDTEVLLHLYEEHGAGMVALLRGMFAFAIWDARSGELFLARDPFGIKPLYYADDGWTFRFASQVKALLAGGKISRQQEPAGVAGFYLFGSVPEPFTLYQEIRALPAGSTLTVDVIGPTEPKSYFSLARLWSETPDQADVRDIQERVSQAVRDSVAHHLVADVPVGAFLSAGIDSGALVGVMSEIVPPSSIKTICLAFEEFRGSHNDESPLAAQVAAQYGTDHTTRYVDEAEFHRDLPSIFDAMDQPTIDGINTWFVSKAAAEAGLKVAVSGLGGDELFGGYPSFKDIPRWVRYFRVPSAVPGMGRSIELLHDAFPALFGNLNPKAASMIRYGGTYAGAYLLKRGLFMPHELPALMGRENAALGLERLKPLKLVNDPTKHTPRLNNAFSRISVLESSLYMRNQLLRDTDWASMAHSLEVRVPLVDTKLIKDVIAVLGNEKRDNAKQFLAGSPKAPLPHLITERSKSGFSTPIDAWQKRDAGAQVWRKLPRLTRPKCPWARRWSAGVANRIQGSLSV